MGTQIKNKEGGSGRPKDAVSRALMPFLKHERISPRQLKNHLENCGLSHITLQQMVDEGWLERHQCKDGTLWNGETYYTLTDRAIYALTH